MKDVLNENINIFERYDRKIIEPQTNMGQENYRDCIKDGFQANFDELIHPIGKLIKPAEKIVFEYERHIERTMELVWQVDEEGELVKEKDVLIYQLKKKNSGP